MKNPPKSDVVFTVDQLKYLESIYPQQIHSPASSEAAMRYYFGTQAVLETVRSKTRGINIREIQTP